MIYLSSNPAGSFRNRFDYIAIYVIYHSTTFSCCQNPSRTFPSGDPKNFNPNMTGVLAPSSGVFVPFPLLISVFTYPGQQTSTLTPLPFSSSCLSSTLLAAVKPALDTAYPAVGQPSFFSVPVLTDLMNESMREVTSDSEELEAEMNCCRMVGEYLLRWPDMEETFTKRPPERMSGSRACVIVDVP